MYRVLVIDDDPDMIELVRRSLPYEDFAVTGANGSIEAQNKLKTQRFDAIFLDIDLGQTDGLALLRFFNHLGITRSIPVLMLTSNASREQVLAAAENGAQAFLRKPVKLKTLQDQLYRVLSLRDIQQENKKINPPEKLIELEIEELFTKIIIHDKLSDRLVREIFSHYEALEEKYPVIALDLRNQSFLTAENIVQLKMLEKLLKPSRLILLAGRNFGDLIVPFAESNITLVISEIDLRRQLRQEREQIK
ncbi:MAG: response regulator [Leptospiraceae bacterium]|nr:response regulator [Leptospiraceae bacterium]MDW8306926.1 response regulator [Leptospiraceae bacterium]